MFFPCGLRCALMPVSRLPQTSFRQPAKSRKIFVLRSTCADCHVKGIWVAAENKWYTTCLSYAFALVMSPRVKLLWFNTRFARTSSSS